MLLSFVVVLAVPWLAKFFALVVHPEVDTAIAVALGIVGGILVGVAARVTDRWRAPKAHA
jgi:hypothetical protein